MKTKTLLTIVLCAAATPAFASESCTSAKNMVKLAQSFYGDIPELTNIVTPVLNLSIAAINNLPEPSGVLYRYDGEEETLAIVDGKVVGFEKAASWSKKGEMCRLVDGEIAPAVDGESTSINMGFSFPYKRTDGIFSVKELNEGAKDGSKVVKSLAPTGLGFAVPGLKSLILGAPEGSEIKPTYIFSRKGEPVSVSSEPFRGAVYISLKDVKSSKADTFTIEGPYTLTAMFKLEPEDLVAADEDSLENEKSED